MSSVTSVFIVVGDSDAGCAEDIAPRVAEAVSGFVVEVSGNIPAPPVISCARDDWDALQGGVKTAGGAVIWFGWNYGRPQELEEHLQGLGFGHLTVWSQHESGGAPRVLSW